MSSKSQNRGGVATRNYTVHMGCKDAFTFPLCRVNQVGWNVTREWLDVNCKNCLRYKR